MRLNEALTARAKAKWVRWVPGVRTIAYHALDGRVTAVSTATVPAPKEYKADAFVLATGGFESGSLTLDSYGNVTETLFGLPLAGTDRPLVHGDYWGAEQPLFEVGVMVDAQMRPRAAAGSSRGASGRSNWSVRWRWKMPGPCSPPPTGTSRRPG